MLKIGLIGSGNTGNQICVLAEKQLKIPVLAVNSSEKDLETVPPSIPKVKLTTKGGNSQGTGKNRSLAKKYLKESIKDLLGSEQIQEFMSDLDVCFVAGSTGGGTGSGTALLMSDILSTVYPDVKIITIGIMPVNSEALSAQVNSLEYLEELYGNLSGQTYMLYDNDRFDMMPSYQMMEHVNSEVVKDIDVLRGMYNITTRYDSIDDEDNLRLISPGGRIVVARLEDIKEKDLDKESIEEKLIKKLKYSAHAELQYDHKVVTTGIIYHLSNSIAATFDNHVPSVRRMVGDPDHDFNHIFINTDRKLPNNVFFIATGLSPVNDRINRFADRIEEIQNAQNIDADANALNEVEMDVLKKKLDETDRTKKEPVSDTVDLNSIFNKYGA